MAPFLVNTQKSLEACSTVISDEPQRYFKYLTFANFITSKCREFADNTCIRFYSKDYQIQSMTYRQVDNFTTKLAYYLYNDVKSKYGIHLGKDVAVAILNTHGVPSFLLIVALTKIKCKMLMISPRNCSEAAEVLIEKTGCWLTFAGSQFVNSVTTVPVVPFPTPEYYELLDQSSYVSKQETAFIQRFSDHMEEELDDIAMIVHSSGTTSFPKPIRLSNRFMLFFTQAYSTNFSARGYESLCTKETSQVACIFPIFHIGGICSSFRSFFSGGSHVYLHRYPPSVNDFVQCLRDGKELLCMVPLPLIEKFISHVSKTNELELLKKNIDFMETGGNAVPPYIVDWFREREMKLGVCYAMSESLPLMTNNYLLDSIEHDILFLMPSMKPHVFMEPFDSQRFQLIIKASSPYIATGVANREDGDYATKDLFFKSKYIDGFYYSGRADDTLVMGNGEKTNPVPMEITIKECPFISNCLVIGQGKPCTALLLKFNPQKILGHTQEEIMESVNKFVAIANKSAPNFSTILPQMITALPEDQEFPTTDKGSISRTKTVAQFEYLIENLYTNMLLKKTNSKDISCLTEDNIKQKLHDMVAQLLDVPSVDHQVSLFDQGLTSLTAIQLRNRILEELEFVPQEFIYNHDTICSMAIAMITKGSYQGDIYKDTETILNKFIERIDTDISPTKKHTVLLTGATGSLGAYLLRDLLLDLEHVKKVYVLVRPDKHQTAYERVFESFQRRKLDPTLLSDSNRFEAIWTYTEDKTYLGFGSEDLYKRLHSEVTLIQACGWMLDFYKPVRYYQKECIEDLYSLIQFAHRDQLNPIPLHYVSSISASLMYGSAVPEIPMPPGSPRVALPLGYGQSKYIAEKLLDHLREEKNMPCYIHRVGQVCGDSVHGVWNTSELVSSILMSGVLHMKQLPDLKSRIDWMPLDYASKTIHQIMIQTHETRLQHNQHIFHIVNPQATSWSTLLQNLQTAGFAFDIVSLETWINSVDQQGPSNPAYKFIDLFKASRETFFGPDVVYETTQTAKVAPVLLDTPALTTDLAQKWFQHWTQ